MWGAQADESMEFVLQLVQIRQSCTHNDSSERVADKGDSSELVAGAVLSDVLQHFLTKSIAHISDISVSLVLIGRRLQENGFR